MWEAEREAEGEAEGASFSAWGSRVLNAMHVYVHAVDGPARVNGVRLLISFVEMLQRPHNTTDNTTDNATDNARDKTHLFVERIADCF